MSNTNPVADGDIRVICTPTVYLLAKQVHQQGELDRFLADHGVSWQTDTEVAAEVITETAGRVCYMSYAKPRPGGNAAYLGHIKEVGHGSVCEHAVWTFLITGVSRSLTHELVRHRAGWAYSQLSQRYVDESVADVVVPPDLAEEVAAAEVLFREAWLTPKFDIDECECLLHGDPPPTKEERAGIQWFAVMAMTRLSYRRLADYLTDKSVGRFAMKTDARKFARQAARSVLPNATETKITVTANARALRHFLEQRGSRHAEPEIRKLANVLLDILVRESPNLFGDYKRTMLPDGTFEITTDHPKV